MFTIDLLKGQGIPIKRRPESIAITAITFAVPVIVAIVIFGCYLSNRIVISIQRQKAINYETKIGELSNAVKLQKSFEKEKNAINSYLSEVSSSIGRHTRWSPVLAVLAKSMPDSIILTRLEVDQKFIKRKAHKKNDTSVLVPVRTLHMSVTGSSQYNSDKVVRDFRNELRSSTLLGPKLEDIRVSQQVDTLEDKDVVSYEIDCIFKPAL